MRTVPAGSSKFTPRKCIANALIHLSSIEMATVHDSVIACKTSIYYTCKGAHVPMATGLNLSQHPLQFTSHGDRSVPNTLVSVVYTVRNNCGRACLFTTQPIAFPARNRVEAERYRLWERKDHVVYLNGTMSSEPLGYRASTSAWGTGGRQHSLPTVIAEP